MALPAASSRALIGVAIAALVVALVIVIWRHDRTPPGPPTTPATTAVREPGVEPPRVAAPRPVALPEPSAVPDPAHGIAGVSTDDPLTAYRKANVYPPTSRPLTPQMVDLLHPNTRHEEIRDTDAGDGVQYQFTADRYFVIGDETITPTLEVRRDGARIPVTITRSFAAVLDYVTHDEKPIPMTYAAAGNLYSAPFAPARLGLARQSTIGLYIEFSYGAGTSQRAHFDFEYTPTAGIPARFTGAFQDAVVDGSLVITAGVAVTRAGPYVIDANLYDAADQPVAWTRFKGDLAAGTREVPLLFFGKVLADAKASGAFHLGQLRGARFDAGRAPDLEQMPPFAGRYETKPYETSAFSDAEWDSPDKQRMIELLTEQKNRGAHQGAAAGR